MCDANVTSNDNRQKQGLHKQDTDQECKGRKGQHSSHQTTENKARIQNKDPGKEKASVNRVIRAREEAIKEASLITTQSTRGT